jgi:bifunctional DNA-binding transcriptional regulator/antitoxin component of YhaV-PrlF toxin-antitoxin module
MDTSTTVHLSESGQLEIPPRLRALLHWEGAMDLEIHIAASGLLIQPKRPLVKRRRLEELRGMLKHEGERVPDELLHAPVNYLERA